MRYKDIINRLNNYKVNSKIILKEELFEIYKQIYNNDNLKTFENLIAYLKGNHIISNYSRDKFSILDKNHYVYKSSQEVDLIDETISERFPDIKHIVWETNRVNEFTHHYAMTNYIIVETEKFSVNHVLYLLKEKFSDYLVLTGSLFTKSREYIFNDEKVIIVKSLHSKSPLIKDDNNKYLISLEKLMVDLLKDEIFVMFQGRELIYIYENIFDMYSISFMKLFNYAKARGNQAELESFLIDNKLIDTKMEA